MKTQARVNTHANTFLISFAEIGHQLADMLLEKIENSEVAKRIQN
jgi:DNA-binding LacI/PurR family transcriptional regulator